MTDADIYTLTTLVRQHIGEYGCSLVEAHAFSPTGHASHWPKVDGEVAFAYFNHADPNEIKVYRIDQSLTVGQFIDTFDVTFNMLYGRTVNFAPTVDPSPGILSGAHTHQFSHGNFALNSAAQVTITAQPSSTSYIQKQLEDVLCSTVASQEEKIRAAHALTGLRSTNKRGIIARLLGP